MSDPTYDFLSSGGASAVSQDPTHDFLASGGQVPAEAQYPLTASQAAGGLFRRVLTGLGSSAIAGARSIYDLARGDRLSEIDKRNQKFITEHTYQPPDTATKGAVTAFESNANPMNWPSKAFDYVGDIVNKATGSTVAGPVTSGVLKVAAGAAPLIKGLGVKAPDVPTGRSAPGWGAEAPEATATPIPDATPPASVPLTAAATAERPGYFEVKDVPGKAGVTIDTEPVEGGLPEAALKDRAAVLDRLGLENARESALRGDAKAAATDFQLTRFDEPAGIAAKAQFDAERAALEKNAQSIVKNTGGTLGTDEDTLHLRGQTIAKPFDDLSDWFDTQRKKLYAAADQRSGGHPVVQPASFEELLNDRSFQNQLTARNEMHLRNGVVSELERFKETNPQGLTVQNAEQFRQFLNTLWTPENSTIIGRLKSALDDDVMKGAGEDLYGPARQLSQLKKQTLDNPNGVSRLLERDPQTPINRTTPFVKIPDTISRLDPAQFDNVVKTLQTMPEELQPQATQALAEIKAHLANKIYDAGNSTKGQWNASGVEKVVKANSAKLQSAFADQPEVLSKIQDLRSGGKILSVDQSYPGAAAQASNALKRGLMSRALSKVGATAGAGAGSVLGPLGAAGGAAAGEALGSKLGESVSEKAAVSKWNKGVRKLSDVMNP